MNKKIIVIIIILVLFFAKPIVINDMQYMGNNDLVSYVTPTTMITPSPKIELTSSTGDNIVNGPIIYNGVPINENKNSNWKPFYFEYDKLKGYITAVYPINNKKRTYLFIGDSIMVSASTELYKNIKDININAKVGRQFNIARDLILQYKKENIIGDYIIIHLGTNGGFTQKELKDTIEIIKDHKAIFLINNRVPRSWENHNNELLNNVAIQYNNVYIINWHYYSHNVNGVIANDGVHLTNQGIKLYVNLILDCLKDKGSLQL